jgi:hypothetical protein
MRTHASGDAEGWNWCCHTQDDDALDALIAEETTLISAAGAPAAQSGNLHSFPDPTLEWHQRCASASMV